MYCRSLMVAILSSSCTHPTVDYLVLLTRFKCLNSFVLTCYELVISDQYKFTLCRMFACPDV